MEELKVQTERATSMLDDRINKLCQQTEMLSAVARNLERVSDKFLGENIEPVKGLDLNEKTKESSSLNRIDSIIEKIDITGGLIEKYTRRLEEGI